MKRSLIIFVFYPAGLTTWLCIAPRTTISTTIPWLILFLITYYILEKKEIDSNAKENGGVKYKKLLLKSNDTSLDEAYTTPEHGVTWREKFSVTMQTLPCITFLFLTYFAKDLSNQSIITTLAFPNPSFSPRDHYQYDVVCYQIEQFVGRSHIFLLSCTCSTLVP